MNHKTNTQNYEAAYSFSQVIKILHSINPLSEGNH